MHKRINSPRPCSFFGVIKPRWSHETVLFLPSVALSFLFSLFLLFPFFLDQPAGESHEEESMQCGPGSTYYRAILSYNGHKTLRKIVGETIRDRFANYVASTVSEPWPGSCNQCPIGLYSDATFFGPYATFATSSYFVPLYRLRSRHLYSRVLAELPSCTIIYEKYR